MSKNDSLHFWITGVLLLIIFFGGGVWIWLSATSYVDIGERCIIRISGSTASANKAAVENILLALKEKSKKEYISVCTNIDHIRESYCPIFDEKLSEASMTWARTGCYVQGTRTVYITPIQSSYAASDDEMQRALINFATYSEEYWTE